MTFFTDKMVLDSNLFGKGKEFNLDKECKSSTYLRSMFCLPSESVLAPSLETYQSFFLNFFCKVILTPTSLLFAKTIGAQMARFKAKYWPF